MVRSGRDYRNGYINEKSIRGGRQTMFSINGGLDPEIVGQWRMGCVVRGTCKRKGTSPRAIRRLWGVENRPNAVCS